MADYPSSDARDRKQRNEFSLNVSDNRSVYEKNQAKRDEIKKKANSKKQELKEKSCKKGCKKGCKKNNFISIFKEKKS